MKRRVPVWTSLFAAMLLCSILVSRPAVPQPEASDDGDDSDRKKSDYSIQLI